MITEAGLYPDVTAEDYHRDPVAGGSLSSTGARLLLPPSCPAKFVHYRAHGRPPKRHFDVGTAAHHVLFGTGAELDIVDAATYNTKAARLQRDAAYDAGRTPVLAAEYEQVQAMAVQVRSDPLVAALLDPDQGAAEQTLVWRDGETGVMCRARVDWLTNVTSAGRRVLVDYKTAAAADPESLSRRMFDLGYHIQAAWYRRAVRAVLKEVTAFVFIAQEKDEPYLITTYEPDPVALRWGDELAGRALRTYAECQAAGRWPGYSVRVLPVPLPPWAESRLEEWTS